MISVLVFWFGAVKVATYNRTDLGGLLGEGNGRERVDRRGLWEGAGGQEEGGERGLAFMR